MRRCHISIIACSSPDDPKSGGLGNSLSRYRQIAIDSAMQVPSSSSRRGIRPKEFFAKYSLFLFSPEIISIGTMGICRSFSAIKIRTLRALGDAGRSYNFKIDSS